MSTLHHDLSYWKNIASESLKKLSSLEDDFSTYRESSEGLEKEMMMELSLNGKQIGQLKRDNGRLTSINETIKERLIKERAEFEDKSYILTHTLHDTQSLHNILKKQMQELEQKHDDLERANRSSAFSLQQLQQELIETQESLAFLETEGEEKDEEMARLKEEIKDLKQDAVVLKMNLDKHMMRGNHNLSHYQQPNENHRQSIHTPTNKLRISNEVSTFKQSKENIYTPSTTDITPIRSVLGNISNIQFTNSIKKSIDSNNKSSNSKTNHIHIDTQIPTHSNALTSKIESTFTTITSTNIQSFSSTIFNITPTIINNSLINTPSNKQNSTKFNFSTPTQTYITNHPPTHIFNNTPTNPTNNNTPTHSSNTKNTHKLITHTTNNTHNHQTTIKHLFLNNKNNIENEAHLNMSAETSLSSPSSTPLPPSVTPSTPLPLSVTPSTPPPLSVTPSTPLPLYVTPSTPLPPSTPLQTPLMNSAVKRFKDFSEIIRKIQTKFSKFSGQSVDKTHNDHYWECNGQVANSLGGFNVEKDGGCGVVDGGIVSDSSEPVCVKFERL